MAADGAVIFEIKGDSKGIDQTIDKVTHNIQNESKKWDKAAAQSANNMEDSFLGAAKKIAAGLAASKVISVLTSWGKAAIEAASDLQEVQNVVDVTFGDGAAQIEAWSKKAAAQFGLTEVQAKKFTSTLGAMAKSAGLTGPEIVTMSTDLAGLAADMASFYNLDFETAFQKIRSGISGETEPLKQLGINMSTANLEAFALQQGLQKTWNQMTQGEQTMLRYQYLMQATSDAQGDFARTSDGYANSIRLIESNIENLKTKIGGVLLPEINKVTEQINKMFEKLAPTEEETVLDQLARVHQNTAEKIEEISATAEEARTLTQQLLEIAGGFGATEDGQVFIDALQLEGEAMKKYLESLGVDSSEVADKQALWLEVCKRLVETLPGLSSIINTQTGEVKGGIQAISDYIDEWEAAEEKAALLQEIAQERKILSERYADRFSMKVDVIQAEANLDRLQKKLDQFSEDVKQSASQKDMNQALWGGSANYTAEEKEYLDTMVALSEATQDLTEKRDKLNTYMVEYDQGLKLVEERENAVIDKYGEITTAEQEAAQGAIQWTAETQEAYKAAQDALKAVSDYVQGVHDATEQAVNSVVKGFSKITRAGDDLQKQRTDLANQEAETINQYSDVFNKYGANGIANINTALAKMAGKWDSLSAREQAAYNALVNIHNKQIDINKELDQYTSGGMKSGLQDQIQYMQEYLDNLEKAKAMGLSNDLLAYLSDGSTDSAAYLAGLVSGGKDAAQEVDKTFQALQAQKKTFTDTLTEQKLTVDEVYDGLVKKAQETVAALNLSDTAASASGETISGIATGISDHRDEVAAAVDGILAELNRLSGWGITFNLGAFGSYGFNLGEVTDGSHAAGLDYVPFNGYLAELHQGEGILTAEENALWQSFKGSGRNEGISSDMLDAILGNNLQGVKAGGNVYLEGRTVGKVISEMQGQAYRSLQRSGWQQ